MSNQLLTYQGSASISSCSEVEESAVAGINPTQAHVATGGAEQELAASANSSQAPVTPWRAEEPAVLVRPPCSVKQDMSPALSSLYNVMEQRSQNSEEVVLESDAFTCTHAVNQLGELSLRSLHSRRRVIQKPLFFRRWIIPILCTC